MIKQSLRFYFLLLLVACGALATSCSDGAGILEYEKNTPTSGDLKVYYDEGLEPHLKNQAYTFEVLYPRVHMSLKSSTESEAVQALYDDSCEAIVISRLLSEKETKAFASKNYSPKYSRVAVSAVALIVNSQNPLKGLSVNEVVDLLTNEGKNLKDSAGRSLNLQAVFDQNNSAVVHYMLDSVLKGSKLSPNCSILRSSIETINYVAENKNSVGLINFAWLSDVDDSVYKANKSKVRILGVAQNERSDYFLPDPSNFKLRTYPFIRNIYVIRKLGDFTLPKGFESFVAGPKGQLTFLKQGLLPARQTERNIEVKTSN
ncbi:MAG: substrate-binding domain-containing protein [Bacteroidia bacterium]|nr:substrate-binding domain-containing protein [Bacteroidia bacterium]